MPLRSLRECRNPHCAKLTRSKEGYCDEHIQEYLNKIEEYKKNNRYRYDRKYDIKRDPKIEKFYRSKAWRDKREYILIRDNGLCQRCLSYNRITHATDVHHIVKLKDDYTKRLDNDNLVSVCSKCHKILDKLNKNKNIKK